MKRITYLLLAIIVVMALTKCSASHSSATAEPVVPPVAVVKPTRGVCIGNSTVARYLGGASVADLLFAPEELQQGYSCHSLAVPGHTIYQQLELWKAYAGKSQADWIMVEIGLNDLRPADPLDSALYRYQKLIDTINLTKKAGAKVILATMSPDRERIMEVFKEQGKLSYNKYLAMNKAIMGKGPHPVTGVDYRFDGHTIALSDKKGNLLPEYEVARRDHVHENTAGRLIIAGYWRIALVKLGLLELGGH